MQFLKLESADVSSEAAQQSNSMFTLFRNMNSDLYYPFSKRSGALSSLLFSGGVIGVAASMNAFF